MNGERFYTFKKGNVRFFALDSNYFDQTQADWLEKALAESTEDWKICFFHHPLYSSGGRHGSEVDLRAQLEPLFLKHGVQVVFAGHEHFYERLKPQKGIYYFVNGGGAKLRSGDITTTTAMTARGFDTDRSYMLVEIAGDVLTFQTLSRTGKRMDSGSIRRPNAAEPATAASRRRRLDEAWPMRVNITRMARQLNNAAARLLRAIGPSPESVEDVSHSSHAFAAARDLLIDLVVLGPAVTRRRQASST